jgi:hypothetical protein
MHFSSLLHLPWFFHHKIFGDGNKFWSFSLCFLLYNKVGKKAKI